MLFLSLFLVFNVWAFSNAQQACSPVVQNIEPSQLPQLYRQLQTRIVVNVQQLKVVYEEFLKYDADSNLVQVTLKEQNSTYSRTLYFHQNEIFDRMDGKCRVSKINETKEPLFVVGGVDSMGNINIKPPNDFLFWNNGVPHRKMDPVIYRGIPANRYQSCQTFNSNGLRASVLLDYYFKTPEFKQPTHLPGDYDEIPLGVTANGINLDTNMPINTEYQFFEYRSFLENRQDLMNERPGEYCEGQMVKEPLPELPNHFSFHYQTIAQTLVENIRFFYSLGWKVTREDAYNPYFPVKDPVKIIHDFNSGIDYIINKVRKNCTIATMGTKDDSLFNAEQFNEKYFIVMKTPKELFKIDDSYFYAGQRYERGQKTNVFVTRRKIDDELNDTASNQLIIELYFGKPQEANYEGIDQIEPVWPVASHFYQPGLPEPVVFNIYDFDSRLKRAAFDISQCFPEKDKIYFGIRFNYPQEFTQHMFDHEFGRRLEHAFDNEIFNAIKIYSASPTRLIPPTFQSHERYFIIYSGFTDIADPIYQFSKSSQRKIKNAGETVVTDSPESCARACILKSIYPSSTDPKCLSFDFYLSSSGPRCNLFPFTHYTNPNVEYEEEMIEHYAKVVETFDVADEKALYEVVQERVVRKEFIIKAHNSSGSEFNFTANDIFEAKLSENDNNGGFTSFFKQFVVLGKDTDFDREELAKRGTLILRERTGISIDECARLCLFEAAFICELMSYGKANQECKWTSLPSIYDIKDEDTMNLFQLIPTFDLFERDPFYNYAKYPYQVTGVLGVKSDEVQDERECALKCNKAKDLHCRSFNFCQAPNNKFRCILSELNVHSEDRNPDLVDSALCNHYSKFAIADYKLITDQTIGVKPESTVQRDSVEGCAELCSFEDKYLCRSFEYVIATSTCYFYRENVVDASLIQLNIQTKQGTNHYSRQYYVENGVLKNVEPTNLKSSGSYGAGTVIGILICVIIGGFLFGVMSAFVYFKISQKSNILPVMRFTNPNYQSQVNE